MDEGSCGRYLLSLSSAQCVQLSVTVSSFIKITLLSFSPLSVKHFKIDLFCELVLHKFDVELKFPFMGFHLQVNSGGLESNVALWTSWTFASHQKCGRVLWGVGGRKKGQMGKKG